MELGAERGEGLSAVQKDSSTWIHPPNAFGGRHLGPNPWRASVHLTNNRATIRYEKGQQ
jgi:hypothetical protein